MLEVAVAVAVARFRGGDCVVICPRQHMYYILPFQLAPEFKLRDHDAETVALMSFDSV
ncbi:MAG: hypothetical protein ACRYGR_09440 [Janthinobacterium lividum]